MSLYARLAGFYFFYYATVGAFMPYWSPYLEVRGFSASQMGVAYALMGLTRSIMPVVWGWWADVSGKRIALIRWAVLASLALFMGIPFVPPIVPIAALMVAYSIFWHAMLSQFEVVALMHLGQAGGDYGRVRLWGSVGFVAAVLALGPLLDWAGMMPLPWLVGLMFAGMAVSAWRVPEVPAPQATGESHGSILRILRQPTVIALLVACTLSQLSFAPYYNFFTLFLQQHGYSRGVAGILWALAVLAEIGMFLRIGRLLAAFGARKLMLAVLAATAVRWALMPLVVDSFWLLFALQLSHALTFGAFHGLAVHYVQRFFPGSLQGRGQALYNATAYGVGGSVGSLGGGYLWQVSPSGTYAVAAVAAGVGWLIARRGLPDDNF